MVREEMNFCQLRYETFHYQLLIFEVHSCLTKVVLVSLESLCRPELNGNHVITSQVAKNVCQLLELQLCPLWPLWLDTHHIVNEILGPLVTRFKIIKILL